MKSQLTADGQRSTSMNSCVLAAPQLAVAWSSSADKLHAQQATLYASVFAPGVTGRLSAHAH